MKDNKKQDNLYMLTASDINLKGPLNICVEHK